MDPLTDPLDMIAEIVAAHRLAWHANSSQALCLDRDCDWEQPEHHVWLIGWCEVAHARHVAEVIRDALAPERVEWSLHQDDRISFGNEAQCRISFGNEAQCRQTRATGGGTLRRRTARYWPDEVSEWKDVP